VCSLDEEWRPIALAPLYQISDQGCVRRLGARKCMAKRPDKKGYIRAALSREGETRDFAVHRLVAMAFIGPPPDADSQVNHLDGVKANNTVANLEWCSPIENMRHSWRTGLSKAPRGEAAGRAKLTDEQVRDIRDGHFGVLQRDLAAKYGVSKSLIGQIQQGTIWTHLLPPDWKPRARTVATCGTVGAYQRHRSAGEVPCDACRVAKSDYSRNRNLRIKTSDWPTIQRVLM
jgi:hypothetical protein